MFGTDSLEVGNVLGIQISVGGYDYERIMESPIVTYILAKLEYLFFKMLSAGSFWVCSFVKCYLLLFMWVSCLYSESVSNNTSSLRLSFLPCSPTPAHTPGVDHLPLYASVIFKWKVPDVITSSAKHHVLYIFIKHNQWSSLWLW